MESMSSFLLIIGLIFVVDLIFIFKRSRNNEILNGDDKSTPNVVENRFGDYCEDCGATIDINHKFCTNCGKEVR